MPNGPSALRANVPARRAAEEAALNASCAFFWAKAAASVLLLLVGDGDDEEARRRGGLVRSARTLRSNAELLRILFFFSRVRNGRSRSRSSSSSSSFAVGLCDEYFQLGQSSDVAVGFSHVLSPSAVPAVEKKNYR